METDIYHDCGHRRRNADKMSTNANNSQMTTSNDNEVARLRELLNRAIEIAETLSGGGSRACCELHHSKKDRHQNGDVCPVEERLEKAVSDLEKLKSEVRLFTAPKEEEIPSKLDAEIEVIDTPATYSVTEARHAIADAILYLCDEIQELKENR